MRDPSPTPARPITTCNVLFTSLLIMIALVWTIVLANQQEQLNLRMPLPPLVDRGHAMMPRVQNLRWLVHIMPLLLLAGVVWHLPLHLTLNLLNIYGLVLLLRGITFWVTRTPPPRQPCVAYRVRGILLGGCSDMMYSGHTSMIVLSALFLIVYGTPVMGIAAVVLGLFSLALLLATRHHYTADVLVAIYICTFAFLALRSK